MPSPQSTNQLALFMFVFVVVCRQGASKQGEFDFGSAGDMFLVKQYRTNWSMFVCYRMILIVLKQFLIKSRSFFVTIISVAAAFTGR